MVLVVFLFGLAVGSFLNCLVYRLHLMDTSPESRSLSQHLRGVLVGRSICPQCGQKIAWRDNLPLLSFVLLGGQCRHCQKKISLHYPLGELITGLLFLAVYQYFKTGPLLLTVYYLLLTASLVAVALSDFLYQTIPDEIVWPGMVLAVLFQFFHLAGVEVVASTPPRWPNGLLGGGMAGSLFLSLVWLTRGRGMGWGDVKLAGLMGLFLGYPQIIVALYIAFLTGALMGVILIMLKKKRFGEQIPFGPFLVGSTIVTLFYGEQIKNLAFGIWHF